MKCPLGSAIGFIYFLMGVGGVGSFLIIIVLFLFLCDLCFDWFTIIKDEYL